MKNKILVVMCVACLAVGFLCGIYTQSRNIGGIDDAFKCEDGTLPDKNGCCSGEVYTDMGMAGFNCCPQSGGNCFPPIKLDE